MDTLLLIDVCNLLSLLPEVLTLWNKVLNFRLKWLAICFSSTEFVVLKLFFSNSSHGFSVIVIF